MPFNVLGQRGLGKVAARSQCRKSWEVRRARKGGWRKAGYLLSRLVTDNQFGIKIPSQFCIILYLFSCVLAPARSVLFMPDVVFKFNCLKVNFDKSKRLRGIMYLKNVMRAGKALLEKSQSYSFSFFLSVQIYSKNNNGLLMIACYVIGIFLLLSQLTLLRTYQIGITELLQMKTLNRRG